MKNIFLSTFLVLSLLGCNKKEDESNQNIITTDIDNFWNAYDRIIATKDSILQYKYLDSLYIKKGSVGLKGIIQVRNYTQKDYINAINKYPKFWSSIRQNTLKSNTYKDELNNGIKKISTIYPKLKSAKIYFTIGALRSNGTTIDSLVLIGSELAMSDKTSISTEFKGNLGVNRRNYFDSNPIENLVLLNIHEYIHTQQNPVVNNLLSYVLHEGIAEFVSTIAMEVPSAVPAINYGKQNEKVKKKFEKEMFYGNNVHHWLWSDFKNEFETRDLGYYIGYAIAEINYNKAEDKQAAIKEMIELDYTKETQIEDFVNRTKFFSKSLTELYDDFEKSRPTILNISQFKNKSTSVNPSTKELTIKFSEPLSGYHTGVDYGKLGKKYFPEIIDRFWSSDNQSWTMKVNLEPNKQYQFLISNNFRTEKGIPLKEYVIEFKTSE